MSRVVLGIALLPVVAGAADPEQQAQSDLIDARIAAFAPQTDGQTDFYFLGFAGFGEERVFAEEIKLAAERVGDRYGSRERTLLLLNDRRDLVSEPHATGVALRHALDGIGKAMNRDEDVLFLVLSSHGTPDAMIEVSNTNLPPRGLAADDLAQLLRDAGIRWQIVVVSACYSGAFVKPLARNESVVITASSKSRTSFGCSDTRHLTYFGEAFFRDALPGARTLRDAAQAAGRAIRAREREEKVRPSQPQSYFGPLIEAKLSEMERGR
jgi:hypothetical protein